VIQTKKDPNARKELLKETITEGVFTAVLPSSWNCENSTLSPAKPERTDWNDIDKQWNKFKKTETFSKLYGETRYGGVVFHLSSKVLSGCDFFAIGTNKYTFEHSHIVVASSTPSTSLTGLPTDKKTPVCKTRDGCQLQFRPCKGYFEQVEIVFDTNIPLTAETVKISFVDHGKICLDKETRKLFAFCSGGDHCFTKAERIAGMFFLRLAESLKTATEFPDWDLFTDEAHDQMKKGASWLITKYYASPNRNQFLKGLLENIFNPLPTTQDETMTLLLQMCRGWGFPCQLALI